MFTSIIGSHQKGDQMRCITVNPLINGLMADAVLGIFETQPASDQLWRPAQANVFFHIASDKVVFEPLSPMRLVLARISSLLGFVGKVIASVNWRCITLELPAKGAGTSF